MRALVWHGKGDVRVDTVADPEIKHPRDAIIKVSACAICGSDLHLLDGYQPTMQAGDILGHENMGVVVALGSEVTNLKIGDRVVGTLTIIPDSPLGLPMDECYDLQRFRNTGLTLSEVSALAIVRDHRGEGGAVGRESLLDSRVRVRVVEERVDEVDRKLSANLVVREQLSRGVRPRVGVERLPLDPDRQGRDEQQECRHDDERPDGDRPVA